MARVWDTPIKSHAAKLVLLALADNANREGFCWPSIATIAKKCSLSERCVSLKIAELESLGLVKTYRKSGTSNRYVVRPTPERDSTPERRSPPNDVPPTPERRSP